MEYDVKSRVNYRNFLMIMKLKNVDGAGMAKGYATFLFFLLLYFTTPIWLLALSEGLKAVFGDKLAYKLYPVVWYLVLSFPFVCCFAGIFVLFRTKDWGTFCIALGSLIPNLLVSGYVFLIWWLSGWHGLT